MISGILLGDSAAVLIGVAAWLTVVYTGAYNVAASDQHADLVRWSMDTTMRRSVASRAEEIEEPEGLSANVISAAAGIYASTCAHCHDAPGQERQDWATKMRPAPPELTEAAAEWEPREIFWIVKNGIKMSGMPAFGPEHGDETLWGLAAFVDQLPGMTAEDYRAATDGTGGGHGSGKHRRQPRRRGREALIRKKTGEF